MKKSIFLLVFGLFSFALTAQVKTPAPSPSSKVEQMVGLTSVTIDYSRPGVKERKIFGNLVPFNEYWRTGANGSTKFTFDNDVKVAGADLAAGTYALFTKPGESSWEIIFYSDYSLSTPPAEWDETKIAAKANVRPIASPMNFESFTIDVNEIRDASALINIMWENTIVPISLEVMTDNQVVASIDKAMSGPSANELRNAANYYSKTGRDMDKALMWINKSLELNPGKFWVLRDKSNILAKMGDYKSAIATAKESMAAAETAGNKQYVKFNQDAIADWATKMK